MTRLVVDAWAWIEYLDGSKRGERVREFLEDDGNDLFCTAISVAEVVSKFLRRDMNPETAFRAMAAFAKIVEIDGSTAIEAGEIHAKLRKEKPDFGLADAFVIAVAEKIGAKIITGDPHFRGVKNAIMV